MSASYARGFACRRAADDGPAWWDWKPPAALEALFEQWGRGLADGGETWGGGRWTIGGWGVVVVRACEGEAAVNVWREIWKEEKGENGEPGARWVGQVQALQWLGVSSPWGWLSGWSGEVAFAGASLPGYDDRAPPPRGGGALARLGLSEGRVHVTTRTLEGVMEEWGKEEGKGWGTMWTGVSGVRLCSEERQKPW